MRAGKCLADGSTLLSVLVAMGARTIPSLDEAHRLNPHELRSGESSSLLWLTRKLQQAPDSTVGQPSLSLSFDLRSRSRIKACLSDGRDVGIVLPRGTVVRGGEWLAGPGLTVQVLAADEDLIDVRSNTPLKLLRAAYHLGNRHIPVQVSEDFLRLGWDSVLADMLIGLDLNIERLSASFEPEAGAYAHGV
ncbi:MAG: Urease accessory protein [Pseudomonadota bacterium]|jgi:urease accessory protein